MLFTIVGYIRGAPIGAFGAMAFTIGKYGVVALAGQADGTFYLTCLVFILVVLGLIARFHGFSISSYPLYQGRLLIVLGTSSSESLPRMMAKLENSA